MKRASFQCKFLYSKLETNAERSQVPNFLYPCQGVSSQLGWVFPLVKITACRLAQRPFFQVFLDSVGLAVKANYHKSIISFPISPMGSDCTWAESSGAIARCVLLCSGRTTKIKYFFFFWFFDTGFLCIALAVLEITLQTRLASETLPLPLPLCLSASLPPSLPASLPPSLPLCLCSAD